MTENLEYSIATWLCERLPSSPPLFYENGFCSRADGKCKYRGVFAHNSCDKVITQMINEERGLCHNP